jgi:hypothetical protein
MPAQLPSSDRRKGTNVILTARHAAATVLAASILPVANAEIDSVSDLLPASSVMVMAAPNAKSSMERLAATPLMGFMKRDDVRAQMDEMMTEMSAGLGQLLGEDEVDPMSLLPVDGLAISIFPALTGATRTALPALVVAGDYGAGADVMWERLGTILTSEEMEDGPIVEEEEVGGRTVWRIAFPVAVDDDMGEMGGMGGMGMMPDPAAMMQDAFNTMWLAREGAHIMLTSNADAVRRMYDVADGVDVDRLMAREDVAKIGDQVGGDRDMVFMMLMRDMPMMLSGVDQMGMLAVATPILQQYIGRITGVGAGMSISGDNAMIEQRMFVSMPDGKSGFTALMDTAEASMDIPSFVPADAISYSQFTFEFDGVAPLIGRLARTAAMMGAPIGDANAVQQIEQVITQFTDTLGRRVHQVQVADQPATPDSGYSVVAIECPDVQGMDQFVSMFGAGMGFEGRDFVGQRIYSMDPAGMMMMMGGMPGGEAPRIAVGLGGGHAIMGAETGVETMLRSVGDAGGASLSDNPGVQRAMAALGGGEALVGWGWSDTAAVMESAIAGQKQQMEEMMAMMGEMDPQMQAQMMESMGPAMMIMNMDPAMIGSMVGDSIFALRSTDEGFIFDSWMFAPGGE